MRIWLLIASLIACLSAVADEPQPEGTASDFETGRRCLDAAVKSLSSPVLGFGDR
jgi:hypothetical protein